MADANKENLSYFCGMQKQQQQQKKTQQKNPTIVRRFVSLKYIFFIDNFWFYN